MENMEMFRIIHAPGNFNLQPFGQPRIKNKKRRRAKRGYPFSSEQQRKWRISDQARKKQREQKERSQVDPPSPTPSLPILERMIPEVIMSPPSSSTSLAVQGQDMDFSSALSATSFEAETGPKIIGEAISLAGQMHHFSAVCVICQGSSCELTNYETLVSTSECGHVFHKECFDTWTDEQLCNGFFSPLTVSCPVCKKENNLQSVHPIYLNPTASFSMAGYDCGQKLQKLTSDNDKLTTDNNKLTKENVRLRKQLEATRKQMKEIKSTHQSPSTSVQIVQVERSEPIQRVTIRKRAEAKCFNCESSRHRTIHCPLHCYVRHTLAKRKSTVYEPQNNELHFAESLSLVQSEKSAGTIIQYYQDQVGGIGNLGESRIKVQVAFALHFFDACCLECASPFHKKGSCPTPQPNLYQEIRETEKRIRDFLHPPTPRDLFSLYQERDLDCSRSVRSSIVDQFLV